VKEERRPNTLLVAVGEEQRWRPFTDADGAGAGGDATQADASSSSPRSPASSLPCPDASSLPGEPPAPPPPYPLLLRRIDLGRELSWIITLSRESPPDAKWIMLE
jgi:hypothetical protein